MEKWPNFFIVGVSKAGTTSLYNFLKDIPGIFLSERKEPHYFSKLIIPQNHSENPIRKKEEYLSLFKNSGDASIIGEASATYISDPEAPFLIHQVSPNSKILISLRDPVERTFSAYLMHYANETIKKKFHDELFHELNYKIDLSTPNMRIPAGFYYEGVKKYIDLFGRENVKVIIFEEWVTNPAKFVNEIIKFLGIDYSFKMPNLVKFNSFEERKKKKIKPKGTLAKFILNNKKIKLISEVVLTKEIKEKMKNNLLLDSSPISYDKPLMNSEDKKLLIDLFNSDVKNLKKLLNYEIPWKNFNN